MFQVAETAAKHVTTLRQAVQRPMAIYELTEGDTRDMTFAQTLPNEPHPALLQACPEVIDVRWHCRDHHVRQPGPSERTSDRPFQRR